MSDNAPLVPGTIGSHTVCLLQKMGQVAFRFAEERLLGIGLRIRHYSVLQTLADRGGMAQAELGGYLRIDSATMVSTLDDLERHGYAERQRDPGDRRRYLVILTEKGSETLTDIETILREVHEEMFADLPEERRAVLAEILGELNDSASLRARFDAPRG
ncbi:MarR family winged helix-turn-helix transcriptional regulator [Nocardia lijiangensis]|uniref:MarR family winged helix-turn-helix transcriptional regulator n=1 Tax=Nocardia lijiangensis TaxID=299618 RepID=UPI00082AF6F9|nr:MarR family transcriptional regulator [Nocardia lijiangensis]